MPPHSIVAQLVLLGLACLLYLLLVGYSIVSGTLVAAFGIYVGIACLGMVTLLVVCIVVIANFLSSHGDN
jgi:hypothetical protein